MLVYISNKDSIAILFELQTLAVQISDFLKKSGILAFTNLGLLYIAFLRQVRYIFRAETLTGQRLAVPHQSRKRYIPIRIISTKFIKCISYLNFFQKTNFSFIFLSSVFSKESSCFVGMGIIKFSF